ncbi:MAG: hypothetical protein KF884_07230 [Fimbriimonadaceae bacterium]|nr:hypothetical protein [Fimbriimonadaceae bacterium]QYK57342.1 MAG: hypothetical protein KF884_07230 [Fimbriimonadaceae bacterium]
MIRFLALAIAAGAILSVTQESTSPSRKVFEAQDRPLFKEPADNRMVSAQTDPVQAIWVDREDPLVLRVEFRRDWIATRPHMLIKVRPLKLKPSGQDVTLYLAVNCEAESAKRKWLSEPWIADMQGEVVSDSVVARWENNQLILDGSFEKIAPNSVNLRLYTFSPSGQQDLVKMSERNYVLDGLQGQFFSESPPAVRLPHR